MRLVLIIFLLTILLIDSFSVFKRNLVQRLTAYKNDVATVSSQTETLIESINKYLNQHQLEILAPQEIYQFDIFEKPTLNICNSQFQRNNVSNNLNKRKWKQDLRILAKINESMFTLFDVHDITATESFESLKKILLSTTVNSQSFQFTISTAKQMIEKIRKNTETLVQLGTLNYFSENRFVLLF
jgi:hypothetical protein